MKIIFIVPSSQWLTSAGVRIRYKRLEPYFHQKGHEISINPLQDITEQCIEEADIVIVSKVFSSDSLYILSLCRRLGVKVGLDLFDDYFSDQRLSVFRKFHDWLELASNMVDFIICSTDRMKQVASQYIEPALIHKINDTKDPDISFSETRCFIDQKSKIYSLNDSLNILWFGIGDNPYFNVGLTDLAHYSNALFQIKKHFASINFTILTNERALTAKNLVRISRLPIQPKLDIWTELKEISYLEESHLAFMPVSHQKFSIAKSSNRCLTALTYGCQVLSNGFDLYSDFNELIYRSTRDFIEDIKLSRFKFNLDTMPLFESICNDSYDSDSEVNRFFDFVESKVFASLPRNLINFCLVNTKPHAFSLKSASRNVMFPVMDGSTFSITPHTNFGIERYGETIYFVFSNHLEDLLLERWHKYLRHKYSGDAHEEFTTPYRLLSIDYVENSIPESKPDIDRVVTVRYSNKYADKVLGPIQSEIYQSISSSSLRKVIKILFGFEHLFYTDGHNKIQPFRIKA